MLVREAETIIHSLSEPSKMPGYGYGLPTHACKTGDKLRKIANSVCSVCYACVSHYAWKPVQKAQDKRLLAILHPKWVDAMVTVLRGKKCRYFRWHDSGDIQSLQHLKKIIKVCEGVPDMMFWLPTKETNILLDYFKQGGSVPPNLCIRLSGTLIDDAPINTDRFRGEIQTCTVHLLKKPHGTECRAYSRGGKCGECRACWDKDILNVSYRRH